MNKSCFAGKYKHNEAFCLMLYQSDKTGHVIDIWNSRDGVTAFMAHIDGEEYRHIAFQFDRCVPWFRPKPGMYIWRTATPADAEAAFARILERDPEVAEHRETIIADMLHNGEAPWLEQVK